MISSRFVRFWDWLRHVFPERQILIRDHGRVRCFTLGTLQQLTLSGAVAGCVLWALLATAAYVDKSMVLAARENEISRQVSELNGMKGDYQAAVSHLDEFKGTFARITCEVSDIQDSLLRIAASNAPHGHHPAAPLPKLDPAAGSGCRAGAATATTGGAGGTDTAHADTTHIVGTLPAGPEQTELKKKVHELEQGLQQLKASHSAFLEHSASLTEDRYGALAHQLSSVGLDADSLVQAEMRHLRQSAATRRIYGEGGPFIAAYPPAPRGMMTEVALYNHQVTRLDDLTLALKAVPLAQPLQDYEITSPFGVRVDPINEKSAIHEGVDLGAPAGTPVVATGDGRVATAGWEDGYGNMVDLDHGMGLHTRYAHLARILVKPGERVTRGTPLGLLGATGRTTGPHLHYEVRINDVPTNPMKFILAGRDVLKSQ
ncbi:murein DD-endopeptidase MepM [mine drainage metagenome]|uniref:Murein DD-endopeptidase MepM n=1 Tax=mine drainage metagenome TaxID=410659 RepID=A0A1J5SDS3_9ZZZZ